MARLADGKDHRRRRGADRLRVPSASDDDNYDIAALPPRARKAELRPQSHLSTRPRDVDVGTGTGAEKVTVNDLTGTDRPRTSSTWAPPT